MKWNKTADQLPERVPNRRYSQVPCLVMRNGEIMILVYNHEHDCWDDEDGDEHYCDTAGVSHWISLSALPKPDDPDPATVWAERVEKLREAIEAFAKKYTISDDLQNALEEYKKETI